MLRRKSNLPELRSGPGATAMGTFVKVPAIETVDVAQLAGCDFVIVDLEHSQLSFDDASRLVRHAAAVGLPAVVRVPSVDPGLVNRLLEAGAHGIQLSSVTSVDQVRALIGATRYAPEGRRSVSLAHPVAGYGSVGLRDVVTAAPPLLVGQIETAETTDPLDEILGAGLDVAFIGTTDLLVDLTFDEERLRARIGEIAKAADAAGVVLGGFAAAPTDIPPGFRYVALGSDVAFLRSSLKAAFEEARRQVDGAEA